MKCSYCGGEGEIDSGGFTPQGWGINIGCPACKGTGKESKSERQKVAVAVLLNANRGRFISPAFAQVEALKGKANKSETASYIFRALERDGLVTMNNEGWAKTI